MKINGLAFLLGFALMLLSTLALSQSAVPTEGPPKLASIPRGTRLPAVARGAAVLIPVEGVTNHQRVTVQLDDGTLAASVPVKVDGKNVVLQLPPNAKAGRYVLDLKVDEQPPIPVPGELLVAEDESVTPLISHVMTPIYPTQKPHTVFGRLCAFTVIGDHFGSGLDTEVAVAGHPPIRAAAGCSAQSTAPCLEVKPTSLQVYGFSPQAFEGQTQLTVRVGSLVSAPRDVTFAKFSVRWLRILAVGVTVLIALGVYFLIREGINSNFTIRGQSVGALKMLVMDKDTCTYSLSRLQVLLWTATSVFAYAYFCLCHSFIQWQATFPDVPDGIPLLLGLSVGTSVAVGGITVTRGTKGAGPESPTAADFISSGGVVMPERFQFFVWTIVGVAGFISIVLSTDPAQLAALPSIPNNFLVLMGVSSAGYLAGKVVRNPGPVINSAKVSRVDGSSDWLVEVEGQNLESDATLHINQQLFSPSASMPGTLATNRDRYRAHVEWLVPAQAMPANTPRFDVTNSDGQSATVSFVPPAASKVAAPPDIAPSVVNPSELPGSSASMPASPAVNPPPDLSEHAR